LDFTDRLASKYQSVFTLPSTRSLAVALFAIGTAISSLVYLIALGPQSIYFGIIDGACALTVGSAISAILVAQSSKKGGILTLRRAMAVMLFSLFLMGIGLFVGGVSAHVFKDATVLERVYFVSCGLLVAFQFIILSAASDLRGVGLAAMSIVQPSSILALHIVLLFAYGNVSDVNLLTGLAGFFAMSLISYAIARWYRCQIEKVGKKIVGVDSFSLLKAFMNALVLDVPAHIEGVLKSVSVTKDVEVRVMTFNTKNGQGAIAAPLTHPGPFRNVGGATLPTNIARAFLAKKVCPVVFHTPTTHDTDLVSSADVELVVQQIVSMVRPGGVATASKPVAVKKGDVTITCQILGGVPLVVITRSPVPTEDLPQEVHDICIKKLVEKGYSDGIVVDAHNTMEKDCLPFSEADKHNLEAGLEDALVEARKHFAKVYVGFHNTNIDKYGKSDGIGGGGVMALVTSVEGEKAAFISIDGNNMVSGLREKIHSELMQSGYAVAEVATTDTHVVTGLARGEGYHTLGAAIPETTIIKKVVESVREAESEMSECLVNFSKQTIPQLHLLGGNGIELLWNVTDRSIKVAKSGLGVAIFGLIVFGTLIYAVI